MLSKKDKAEIKKDFTEWSGGWAPQSNARINLFIQLTLNMKFQPRKKEVKKFMTSWMAEDQQKRIFDPDKTFALTVISRTGIAKDFNEFLGRRVFSASDKRLTDSVCTQFAACLGQCSDLIADKEAMRERFFKKHFSGVEAEF